MRWLAIAWAMAAAMALNGCATRPDDDGPPADEARCAPLAAATGPAMQASTQPSTQAAARPAAASRQQTLQGQLSIKLHAFGKTPARGISLGFFFSGGEDSGQLDLITLMGSQFAQVSWTPGEVWLTDDKGRRRYESMEALSAAALGEPLPLRALVHWMQGRPDPSLPGEAPSKDGFSQLGWRIDTREMAVKKLTATRDGTPAQRGAFVKVYLDR